MPAWSPGDYQMQNHGQWVRDLRATSARGETLQVRALGMGAWEVQTGGEDTVTIRYSLPNTRPGNFSANVQVGRAHSFHHGPATFAAVEGFEKRPSTLEVRPPAGWRSVACALDPGPGETNPNGLRSFVAPDYDTLVDSPIVTGKLLTHSFTEGGKPHQVVVFGDGTLPSPDGYAREFRPFVREALATFGGAPYPRYLFLLYLGRPGSGLEHGACTVIGIGSSYPPADVVPVAAHEFVHAWNVKRVRPLPLGPFDYWQPARTRSLWFCEGVTDYQSLLLLRRGGTLGDAEYRQHLAALISILQQTPARLKITAEESSLRVWDEPGSQGYGGLSYYLKGHLVGLCLDLKIRAASGGRQGLDELFRDLLARYSPPRPGYSEDGIREALVRLGGPELGPFYDRLVRSTDELPLEECLAVVGYRLVRSPAGYEIRADSRAAPEALRLRAAWLASRQSYRGAGGVITMGSSFSPVSAAASCLALRSLSIAPVSGFSSTFLPASTRAFFSHASLPSKWPEGAAAIHCAVGPSGRAVKRARSVPLSTSQRRTRPSPEPAAQRVPSGLKATV